MTATTTQTQQIQPINNNSHVAIPTKIELGTIPTIISMLSVFVVIGIAWGTLKTLVKEIKETLNNEIKPDLKEVRERFIIVEERVDTIWKDRLAPARSPRQLNDMGQNILTGSGIKEIVDTRKEQLLELVKAKNITNAYDAEEAVLSVVIELPERYPDMMEKLKTGAFRVGADVDAVLFVGGIYLRNEIFSKLGFSLEDLDKPKT